jgi:type IV pilus assembly protein PilQ
MAILSLVLASVLVLPLQEVSFDLKDADLRDFFRMVAESTRLNVVLHPAVQGRITLNVQNAPLDTLLEVVLKNYGLGREINGSVMRIVPLSVIESELRQRADIEQARLLAQPLETRIYVLNYAKAADVAPLISRFLSPRGEIVVDTRRNAIIIRDVPR